MPVPVGAAAPDTPVVTIDSTTSTSVTASWVAGDGGEPPVTYEATISPDDGAGAGFIVAGSGDLSTTFTGLDPSTTYTVSVIANNLSGIPSAAGTAPATTDAAPVVPPSSVVVTIGTATETSLQASWTSAGDPATYEATISPDDGAGAGAVAAGSADTSTTFTGLTPGASYTVTVTATNGGGADGGIGVGSTQVADPVITTFTVTADGSDAIDVAWAATAGGGTNLYTTTITPAAGGGGVTSSAATSTRYTGLSAGVTYTVGLTATNAGGNDTASDTATTGINAPVVGTVTVTSTGETSVSASWTATDGGGTNAYTTSISPNEGTGGVTASAATTTTYTGLNPGTTYTVTVEANNGSTDTNSGSATTDVASPAVSNVNAIANGSTGVNVTWDADDGGGTNTYVASISPADASPLTGLTGTSASFSGLTPGQTYTVTVTPTNQAGAGTADSDTATTAAVAATAPRNVAAGLGGAFNNFVTVTWDAPSNTGGSAVTSYIVTLSNGQSITVNDGNARSTSFETVAAGATVTAQVRAVTGAGNGANSSSSNSVTTSNVPGSVTGLSASWAGSDNINAIDVSWTAPSSTGGLSLNGYVVDVSPPLENPIPVVAAGETSVVIGGLDQGTSYTITVRAQNDRGNSGAATSGAVLVPSTPGTVTDLVIEQSPPFSSGVILTWALPAEDGGSPITGYSIVVDDRDPLVVGPTVTTATFSGLPVGDHNVTIQAITAAGTGATVTSPNFEVKAFAPFDSEEDFVTQLYADFLRRTPDAAGLAFWTERVANDGSNVQDIVEAFMRSPEFAPRRAVARLYFAYFNRQPDKGGFDFWTRQISTGAAVLENASQSFAQSPEFASTYGSLNDAEFIVLVYNNVLARRPDQGGFEFWLDELADGLPRGTMMTLFSESPENIPLSRPAVDVTVTYDGLLQRAPDVEGFRFWTGRVGDGGTGLTELIRQFYFSLEYADRVNR